MPKTDWTINTNYPLSFKAIQFCREYLVDLSIQRAAIRAGFSPKTAAQAGSRLMRDPRVLAKIEEIRKELSDKTGITPERVLHELALIAFSNVKDIVSVTPEGDTTIDLAALDREKAAALSEISIETTHGKRGKTKKVKGKNADKLLALNLIAKHLGMLKDQVEHSGNISLEQLITKSMDSDAE